jgi:tRNA 2-thiouridine synthesizing protein A
MSDPDSTIGSDGTGSPLVLDGGDARCVQLLFELHRLVAGSAPGTLIHLIATDPAAPIDLPAWCHLTGHTYLGPLPAAALPTYAVQVRAAARATHPDAPGT